MFSEDANLVPTITKDKFHNKFPNIDINSKEINNYIRTQYRIMKIIHSEYIKNTESIFELKDNKGEIISKIEEYEDLNKTSKKLILIGNKNMYNNIKDNKINQNSFLIVPIKWYLPMFINLN